MYDVWLVSVVELAQKTVVLYTAYAWCRVSVLYIIHRLGGRRWASYRRRGVGLGLDIDKHFQTYITEPQMNDCKIHKGTHM